MATSLFDKQLDSQILRARTRAASGGGPLARLKALRRLPQDLAWARIAYALKAPLLALAPPGSLTGSRAGQGLLVVPSDPWPGDATRGAALLEGRFCFAGLSLDDPDPLWLPHQADNAWLRGLHDFSWLSDLRALGGDTARRGARDLTESWLAARCYRHPVAREPMVLSRRITHWLQLHDFFIAPADPVLRQKVLTSLAQQAALLARLLPAGLCGSELIAAIRGLVTAGCCLPAGEAWLEKGLALLEKALQDQVLGDGGQAERSPGALFSVLRDLVGLRALLMARKIDPPAILADAVGAMGPCLRLFQHGDGDLALFNGTRLGQVLELEMLLQRCPGPKRPIMSAPDCGFQRLQAGRSLLIVDAGTPPPAGLDTHSHAGPLAFEFSVGRERLVVNCGARPWDPDWSAALRATAAHSTVTIDDTNAAELLPQGGLGRRPTQVRCRREEQDGCGLLDLSHDGYDRPFGLIHHRRLYLAAGGDDLRGEDRLAYSRGSAPPRPFKLRFHLHPEVRVSLATGGEQVIITTRKSGAWILRANGAVFGLEPSVYLGAEGEIRRAQQVVLSGETQESVTTIKWALRREATRAG